MSASVGAQLNEFLDKLENVSLVRRRAAASLLGSCVADAASRPLHWIYDKEKLATLLAERVRIDVILIPSYIDIMWIVCSGSPRVLA